MRIQLPLLPLLGLVFGAALSNLFAMRKASLAQAQQKQISVGFAGALLGFDILTLTGLLYFSGGPFNPFSFLYLVYVTLSAVILNVRWTWGLLGLSLAGFGALFIRHAGVDLGQHHHDSDHVSLHLQGMWVAFGVAAGFIIYFVQQIKSALSAQESQLETARELSEKSERLASLATLAAGAAHELATPLATIAVVSKELQRELEQSGAARSAVADAQLIRQELQRCRSILDHMSSKAGETAGESIVPITLDDLIDEALDGLPRAYRIDVELPAALGQHRLNLPPTAMAQALRGILKNAIEASEEAQVKLSARFSNGCIIEIKDRGRGMSEEVLKRVGEPFFTTKEPGMGMGLGLFLTRALLERLGGRLEVHSKLQQGTTVTMRLP